jgi:hypothetical protein
VTGDATAIDLDVHGASTCAALLQGATGIVTASRLPAFADEPKGAIDFLEAGMDAAVNALWEPGNLGKSFRAVPETARLCAVTCRVAPHTLVWTARDTRTAALAAADPAPRNAPLRARFAKCKWQLRRGWGSSEGWLVRSGCVGVGVASPCTYPHCSERSRVVQRLTPPWCADVNQYCSYFAPRVLLPRLVSALLLSDASPVVDDFLIVLRAMFGGGGEDPRGALFDATTFELNEDLARRCFAELGIVTDAGALLIPYDMVASPAARVTAAAAAAAVSSTSLHQITALSLSAAGDIRGGGTGREFVENLLRAETEPWCKWVHGSGYVRTSYVDAEFLAGPHCVRRYGLCSANDAEHRDPAAWRLLGRRVGGGSSSGTGGVSDWVPLHTVDPRGGGCPFTARWQWHWFDLPDDVASWPLTAVRLEITRVRRPGDCIQLGHWHLMGDPAACGGGGGGARSDVASATAGSAHASREWACRVCTFLNTGEARECEMCEFCRER